MHENFDPNMYECINFDNIKTKFAQNLYKKIVDDWIKSECKTPDDGVDILPQIYYSINKFLYYQKIKYIIGPEKDITFWFNKEFNSFVDFIYNLDYMWDEKKAKKDVTVILENSFVKILIPNTYSAACKYGAGTKWCITYSKSLHHWNRWNSENHRIFYFLPKKNIDKFVLYTGSDFHFTDKADIIFNCEDFIHLLLVEYKLAKNEIRILFNELKKNISFEYYKNTLSTYKTYYKSIKKIQHTAT